MSSREKELFLIDTDAGLDDAQAILIALAAPHVDVVGITTVSGNTTATQVSKNVLRLLKAAGRLEIPVYTGTERTLIGWQKPDEHNYHGNDGFGDVPDDNPPDFTLIQKKHGVQALLDISQQHEGKITLVALGPLTNLSLAIRLDPNFGKRLKACYIMGGNYKGRGNVTPSAEFNFYTDPEAAHIVLADLGCPITMICWELCLEYSFSWDKYHEFRSIDSPISQVIKNLESGMHMKWKEEFDRYITCDEVCMACAVDDSVAKTYQTSYASVELHESPKRGAMLVDKSDILIKESNCRIVLGIHEANYETLLKKALN